MRGVAGEFRFDGGQAGNGRALAVKDRRDWRSSNGAFAVSSWGAAIPGDALGWTLDAASGVLLVADAALYDPDHLRRALELPAEDLHAPLALLLEAWRRWGEAMPARLDGDYAFIVCDLHRRRAIAATDPMGVRPLFHRFVPGRGWAFASTAEALAEWLGLDPRIPESRLLEPLFDAEQLAHLEPEIPGVQRLPAAHLCQADAEGLRCRRWWRPGQADPGLPGGDVDGWVDGVRWHLSEAVRKRVAGVRAGVQFSGGLDSSAVLALACAGAGRSGVHAYSLLDHGSPACPETRAIEAVLADTGVAATCIDLADVDAAAARARDAIAQLPRFVLGRSGFLALFEQMAAQAGMQVMMNGLDADAMFFYEDLLERQVRAGQYREALRNARLHDAMGLEPWMQAELRRLRLSSRLPWGFRQGLRRVRARLAEGPRLRAALLAPDASERFGLRPRVRAYLASLRKPRPPASGLPTESLLGAVTQDAIGRFQARARHFGLEMRCPFLDRALIEFAAWVPLELRLRDGHMKWILRQAMEAVLPPAVAWRGDKLHLGSYFDRAMLQPVLEGLLRDYRGSGPAIAPYVDRAAILEAASRWQAGDITAVWRLKMPLLLEHWLQHNAGKVALGR